MSASSFARKSERFVCKNPNEDASLRMRKTVAALLRTRQHNPALGIADIVWDAAYKAGEADRDIKYLAKCPVIVKPRKLERREVVATVERTMTDWESLAKSGKLGKVAQKKALAIS